MDDELQGDISSHLESLPGAILDQLYAQPSTCLVVFRLLPILSRHICLRMLYTRFVDLSDWVHSGSEAELTSCLGTLQKLHLLKPSNSLWIPNGVFTRGLHTAFCGGDSIDNVSFGVPPESEDKQPVDVSTLDEYAQESWESVLHYLVGTPCSKRPKSIITLLERSGLMALTSDDELRITNKGFQFLLQPLSVQIWFCLLQYLQLAEELNMQVVEMLNFLFQLASLEFGQDYTIEALTLTQKHMLEDLKYLGLVYQRSRKSTRFYPTRLATTLASGTDSAIESTTSLTGFIIVETNYRVYMYTSSPLQIAVLSLFVSMRARFANMVVGTITRDSVREALANGITADQIVTYLSTHAHPEMRKCSPVLPSTVIDQIRLWEMEKNRLRVSRGHLYTLFSSNAEYQDVLKFGNSLDAVLWHSDTKRILALSTEGHEAFRLHREKLKSS